MFRNLAWRNSANCWFDPEKNGTRGWLNIIESNHPFEKDATVNSARSHLPQGCRVKIQKKIESGPPSGACFLKRYLTVDNDTCLKKKKAVLNMSKIRQNFVLMLLPCRGWTTLNCPHDMKYPCLALEDTHSGWAKARHPCLQRHQGLQQISSPLIHGENKKRVITGPSNLPTRMIKIGGISCCCFF